MTPEQSRLFTNYVLGMPERGRAEAYLRFSAPRLDDTFFSELDRMIDEARSRQDREREESLDWLKSTAAEACQKAQAPFAEARERSRTAQPEPESDSSRAMRMLAVDRRVTAMMMRTHFNPVDETVIADWKAIADDYRELTETGAEGPLFSLGNARQKLAQALESLARAYAAMDDDEESREHYRQAAEAFEKADQPNEAARCRAKLAELPDDAPYDDQMRPILEDLERLRPDAPDYFSRLIDLGEIQARNGDDFAAEKTLLKAEEGLERTQRGNPSGGELAEALVATLKGVYSAEGTPPGGDITSRLAVRNLHLRIHLALSDIHRRLGDESKAEARSKKAEELAYSSPDDEFSTTMRKLTKEWENLS